MDKLLNKLESVCNKEEFEAIAYADDLVFIIKADTRLKLEQLGSATISSLEELCMDHKLKIAHSKSTAMMFTTNLADTRNPKIKIGDINVRFTNEYKYLGVTLDSRLTFLPHVRNLRGKITSYIMQINRLAKKEWGINTYTGTLYTKK
jgi:hypothetical protein